MRESYHIAPISNGNSVLVSVCHVLVPIGSQVR